MAVITCILNFMTVKNLLMQKDVFFYVITIFFLCPVARVLLHPENLSLLLSDMLADQAGVKSTRLNDDLCLHIIWPFECWSRVMKSNKTTSIWLSGPSVHCMTPCWTVTPSNMVLKEHDRYVSFNLIDLLKPFMTIQWKLNKSASWNGSELHCFHAASKFKYALSG